MSEHPKDTDITIQKQRHFNYGAQLVSIMFLGVQRGAGKEKSSVEIPKKAAIGLSCSLMKEIIKSRGVPSYAADHRSPGWWPVRWCVQGVVFISAPKPRSKSQGSSGERGVAEVNNSG